MRRSFREQLATAQGLLFTLYCSFATFSTYFCMYAFRKPFTAGTFADDELWGVPYKTILVISQVLGYTLSKFTGIKVVSEMTPPKRIAAILVLIGVAEVALLGFALVPAPYNFTLLFLNGLPLGMIWGIVFSFVEGRRFTEMLGAALCCSFILASGAVKSVGASLVENHGVSEYWMPAVTGLIFALPLLVSVWLLSKVPPPTGEDELLRSRRQPMSRADRIRFLRQFAVGIGVLVAIYALLNAYRDFRDNFAVELWSELGYGGRPLIFTQSETPIAVVVLLAAALMVLIKDNRKAFGVSLGSVVFGAALVGVTTIAFQAGAVSGALWMVAVGLGMYLPYIAFHVMVYERLIAVFRHKSNVGFLMYVSDAFGYAASVTVMLYRDFGAKELSWREFFVGASYGMALASIALALFAWAYFRRRMDTLR